MPERARTLVIRGALFAGLVLAAWGVDLGRRAYIKQFFADGAVPTDTPVWPGNPTGAGLRPVARVRVVLLDGLGQAHARRLSQLSRLCAAGQELTVDVGFPTVSLPVQHALWTGRTQQQSGLQYHIGKLPQPPANAIPRQVDSVAVAESHPEIVHSFGFGRAEPAEAPLTPEWRPNFAAAALAAVTSPARLAFVHVLRIDEAGHASGADSLAYGVAAAWSDALLGVLHAAAPADPSTLWLVLADHGHRGAGGHGGSEPDIRLVRACVLGGGVEPGELDRTGRPKVVHLVDVSRALADALAATLHPEASGRPWAAALAEPARGATIPRPGPARWLLGGGLLLLGLLSLRTGHSYRIPWLGRATRFGRFEWPGTPRTGPRWLTPALGAGWAVLALLGVVVRRGWPTLSNPAIYPPLGRDLQYASGLGFAALLALALLAALRWDWSDGAIARAVLVPFTLVTAGVLVLARTPDAIFLGTPPLMPWTTGLGSVLMVQGRGACLLLALVLAIRGALWARSMVQARRRRPPETTTQHVAQQAAQQAPGDAPKKTGADLA